MVITSLLGALPAIGGDMLLLLWGSYFIDNFSLHRFYSLHFTLPFIILAVVFLHFFLLHEFGSNNSMGIYTFLDNIPFIPYYGIKDAFSLVIILLFFFIFVILVPDKLGHSDNFILANALVTPAHIVPDDIFYHYMQYYVQLQLNY
jgi:quinol-cytochrome oxidoreductase complex cytochrome b subunit